MVKEVPGLREFLLGRDRLVKYRAALFPKGTVVRVECERFNGLGIVVIDGDCPVECLPVFVQSRNVWFYPLEKCRPFPGPRPRWMDEILGG